MEAIQAPHVHGLDPQQFIRVGVLRKKVRKEGAVIQIFRNGHANVPLAGVRRLLSLQQQDHAGHDCRQHRHGAVAHTAAEPHGHGEEDRHDVPGGAGGGAEAHQAERARDRHACAKVAVDQQDHELHQKGQHRQRRDHRSALATDLSINQRDTEAQRHREQAHGEEHRHGHRGRIKGRKNSVKHSVSSPFHRVYVCRAFRTLCRIWKTRWGISRFPKAPPPATVGRRW